LDSVRKPEEGKASAIIRCDNEQPSEGIPLSRVVPLVTPENCEYVCHVRRTAPKGKPKTAWCGAEIHGFHFVDAEHAASNGGRLMSCLNCNNALVKALDNGWGEDHEPDTEDEE